MRNTRLQSHALCALTDDVPPDMQKKRDVELPMTPESQVTTRSRKRRRSLSPSDDPPVKKQVLDALPPSSLLLALPKIVAVPPNHKSHIASYFLSVSALRKCVSLEQLPPDIECRAWTALSEMGLKIIRAGWTQSEYFPWAKSLELEVENAIGKGLLIAQRSPALVVYKQALTLLHVRLAHWQQNAKHARTLLKRLVSSFSFPSTAQTFEVARTPSWLVYTTHLTSISHALSSSPPDLQSAFSTLQDLLSASERLKDAPVRLLSHVLRLRTLVNVGMWDAVGASLALAESALGLSYDLSPQTTPKPSEKGKENRINKTKEEFVCFEDPFEAAMSIHVLIMGVVYFTHMGKSKSASSRLSHLHALLDSDVLMLFPNGTIEIALSAGPPMTIKCTHPRVLYHLAYLVSSISKRDAAGRKPKRKVFASEGLVVWDKEAKKEISLLPWADPGDAEEVDERMVKMKADLLSELVAVCIMRSEFDDATQNLMTLVAHTRTFGLFSSYAARITLHHAHLAHALGDQTRAARCYVVAADLAAEGTFVNVSARAGHLALRIACGEGERRETRRGQRVDLKWEAEVHGVVEACKGMGGTLEAIGHVLQAYVSPEILTAKAHLKSALDKASDAQDNHLRALVLALVSALYLRTAEAHARKMLETCGQLAVGLGAPPHKPGSSKGGDIDGATKSVSAKGKEKETAEVSTPGGNVALGLWVGERFLEIYKRDGNEKKARNQEQMNAQLALAVDQLAERRQLLNELESPS